MRYCLNCDQNVEPKKIVPTGNKILSGIIGGFFFIMFLGFMSASISPFSSYDTGGFFITLAFICLLLAIAVFGGAYYTSPKSCPICESVNWKIGK